MGMLTSATSFLACIAGILGVAAFGSAMMGSTLIAECFAGAALLFLAPAAVRRVDAWMYRREYSTHP